MRKDESNRLVTPAMSDLEKWIDAILNEDAKNLSMEFTSLTIEEKAKEYAERVCNGQFPITYTREQVVKHTAIDFIAGANEVLPLLRELAMRSQICFPETEEDLDQFNEGIKGQNDLFLKIMTVLDLGNLKGDYGIKQN